MKTVTNLGRVAGLLYLLLIVCGVFAEIIVRANFIVVGDASATAQNILASEWLFRAGFVSDVMMLTTYFFLVMVLYILLKPIGKTTALVMVLSVVISICAMLVNLLNHFAPIILLNNAAYLAAFGEEQLHAAVLFFLDLHKLGYLIAQPFFGLWLLPLGYLVYKSGYFPRILGVALMIACFAYQVDFFIVFLFPTYRDLFAPFVDLSTSLAEFAFCFWLLFKGAKPSALQI